MKIKAKELEPGQVFWTSEESTVIHKDSPCKYRRSTNKGILICVVTNCGCDDEFFVEPERDVWVADPKEERGFPALSTENHMLKHRVRAKDVPLGMTFFMTYDDLLHPPTGDQKGTHLMGINQVTSRMNGRTFALAPDTWVWVSKPELCKPKDPVEASYGKAREKYGEVLEKLDDTPPTELRLMDDDHGLRFYPNPKDGRLRIREIVNQSGIFHSMTLETEQESELLELLLRRAGKVAVDARDFDALQQEESVQILAAARRNMVERCLASDDSVVRGLGQILASQAL